MKTLNDYSNAFDAILEFEHEIAKFTGAPYAVTTDCCTHAIEISFRLSYQNNKISFPCRTYLSVLQTMHKLNIPYDLLDLDWKKYYVFQGSNIWDCARYFQKNMYVKNSIQCISFGRTKPLEIGKGGCILTDDKNLYEKASRMRYDGRDIFKYRDWATQQEFDIGYHYYLKPEECVIGLNKLLNGEFVEQIDSLYNYPDCRRIKIRE
jgi:dTDP-4-amino-4,6-dideoxygalactose transaminase